MRVNLGHERNQPVDVAVSRDLLRRSIDLLPESEVQEVARLVESLQQKQRSISSTLRQLASDPTFKLPEDGKGEFRIVKPIQGGGEAASELLIADRR